MILMPYMPVAVPAPASFCVYTWHAVLYYYNGVAAGVQGEGKEREDGAAQEP